MTLSYEGNPNFLDPEKCHEDDEEILDQFNFHSGLKLIKKDLSVENEDIFIKAVEDACDRPRWDGKRPEYYSLKILWSLACKGSHKAIKTLPNFIGNYVDILKKYSAPMDVADQQNIEFLELRLREWKNK